MSSISFLLLLSVSVAIVFASPQSKYTDKFDNINVDSVLSNDRALNSYVKCMLDQGPCSPPAQELKKNLPEAIQTSCAKCTDTQRRGIRKVVSYMVKNRKSDWELLRKKYDPKNQYGDALKKLLAEA